MRKTATLLLALPTLIIAIVALDKATLSAEQIVERATPRWNAEYAAGHEFVDSGGGYRLTVGVKRGDIVRSANFESFGNHPPAKYGGAIPKFVAHCINAQC